jgi:hypothetical protein
MSTSRDTITLAALEQTVAKADAAAILVPQRILRRIIKQHAHLPGIGLSVPHRKVYVLHREALLAIADRAELELPIERQLPEKVIVLAQPAAERLSLLSSDEALTYVWRLLFHGRIHLLMDDLIAQQRLTVFQIRNRIRELERTSFEEIRTVLRSEDLLLPPKDDPSVYVEFVAVYLELRYFASSLLPAYFPSLGDTRLIDQLIARDVPAAEIFASTRPEGAPAQPDRSELLGGPELPDAAIAPRSTRRLPQRIYRKLAAAADRFGPLGNAIRSTVNWIQNSDWLRRKAGRAERFAALANVAQLATRLQGALGFSDGERNDWERALKELVNAADGRGWTPALRLLYDLQNVCLDHERGIYALDLIGWICSGFKQGIKRPLPGQREIMIAKHLRGAVNRLPTVPMDGKHRRQLSALLNSAEHRAQGTLRARFGPILLGSFDAVQLVPHNLPEQIARDKLIDELLDTIVEHGYLTMGDLRDGISRNNLKLPDVTQWKELQSGDQLLQIDRLLGPRMDGVYRRGEVYLRFPQKLSSLAFGTPPGRFLTQYVAIPFGGAYVLLEFIQHLVNAFRGHHEAVPEHSAALPIDLPTLPPTPHDAPVHLTALPIVLMLGGFLLGLLHHAGFRLLCLEVLLVLGRGLRKVFYEFPVRVLKQPWVQAIVRSWPFKLFQQYFLKPGVLTVALLAVLSLILRKLPAVETSTAVFVIVNLVLNSRFGRTVDEMVTDWVVTTWHRFRIHVLAAFVRGIMELFQGILDAIERLLYTVDEWLRFRAGEGSLATAIKAVLAVIWSVVNYVIRFFVTLLIEPQINPIKHFPVVTVSHKVILPTLPLLIGVLQPFVGELATPLATAIVFLTPGIFGFLVWELKENWRLYAANRPKNLRPVRVGHHGETMLQLMRPGFRSGTLPKLFAHLRRAGRRAYWTDNWRASERQLHALHDVEELVRRFVDRELAALLEASRGWGAAQLTAGEIELGINAVRIELYSPDHGEDSLWISFEEHAGWLVAGLSRRGWLDQLSTESRTTFENALAGFYKMAGVDLIREEIEATLSLADADYAITDEGLVSWQSGQAERHLLCDLHDGDMTELWDPVRDLNRRYWPIDPKRLLDSNRPISWDRWVATWQAHPKTHAGSRKHESTKADGTDSAASQPA